MKERLYAVRCLKSNEDMILALAGQFKQFKQVRGSYLHLISNTALHITFLSYDIPFRGKHEPNKMDLLSTV